MSDMHEVGTSELLLLARLLQEELGRLPRAFVGYNKSHPHVLTC